VVKGPGNLRLTTPVEITETEYGSLACGKENEVYDSYLVTCDVDVVLPAGSPAGTYSVESVSLTDNVGNTRRVTDGGAYPIILTRNGILSATDFALNPSQVDNWREDKTATLTFTPHGAVNGLATVEIPAGGCIPASGPVTQPDGTATVAIRMLTSDRGCTISGLVMTDGAGNVAVYGSSFGAPPINLTVSRVPDTTPPVVTGATLSRTTWPVSDQPFWGISVRVTVLDEDLAPIDGGSVTVYNEQGWSVGGGSGGARSENGVVTLSASVRDLPVGTYTVGFVLDDAAGNTTAYGHPGGAPIPGGPLIITVTEG
jgi:hypothetical protein